MNEQKTKKSFGERCADLWKFFSTYEKIWFFSILVLAIIFAIIFPETDDPTYTVTLNKDAYTDVSDDVQYTTLNFSAKDGDFVIDELIIKNAGEGDKNGELNLKELIGVQEYTLSPEGSDTLSIKLPEDVKITKESTISFGGYPDDDGGTFLVSVTNDDGDILYSGEVSMGEEGDFGSYSVKEITQFLVSVQFLMFLYLMDIVTNIACELLISKQSKWNFIVSLLVEIIEIAICIVCMYRFATMAVTLLFWIPCDIISFITWHRHRDKDQKELTVVKKLSALQATLVIAAIVVWTVVIGYLLTFIEVEGGIFASNVALKNIVCYLDACVSAVGIANGVFILLRYREQWIAWYISTFIETAINIMAGQFVLLVLKAGYLTNTTYGYIKWTRYIKSHKDEIEAEKAK